MLLLHLEGVSFIQWLQTTFSDFADVLLFLTRMGDPRHAFLVYFPLALVFSRSVGLRTLLVAIISEWTNLILKWMLHGERPFWWINDPEIYEEGKAPHLEQYSLTCETGPGSPSGHCMVTAAVLWVVTSALVSDLSAAPCNSWKRNPMIRAAPWLIYSFILTAAGVSRLFIATHFPHQVVFGTAVGTDITRSKSAKEAIHCPSCQVLLHVYKMVLISKALGPHSCVNTMGIDPSWSIKKATQWCAHPEWVHLGTTPFFSVARDSGSSLGLAVALHSILPQVKTARDRTMDSSPEGKTVGVSTVGFLLLLLSLTLSTEYLVLPQEPQTLLYSLVFVKSALLTVGVIGLVTGFSKLIQKKQKNW
uniref:glucose-6-phosphatase n=1 Tax=Branchiostoma floridae TaxID=7739 RepID=C3Z9M9_BRAFL|eukprot:XP_002594714.1 hypothetical protein BRAFLDRAFT_281260 [Branchiostoma floridae]